MATTTTTYTTETRPTPARTNPAIYWGIAIALAIILVAFLALRDRPMDNQVTPVAPTAPATDTTPAPDTTAPPSTSTDVNGAGTVNMESESGTATESNPAKDSAFGTGVGTEVDKTETGTSNSGGTVNQ